MLLPALIVAISYSGQTLALPPDAFTVPLDADELHTLYWTLDYDAQKVSLEAHFRVPADNWVALGFSDYGEITNADLCVLWAGQDATRLVEDSWTDEDGVLYKDQSQDCELSGFERTDNSTIFNFKRKFNTSDQHDYVIEEGTTHVVWASGSGPLARRDGLNMASARHGLQRTDLLRNLKKISLPPDTFTVSFTKDDLELPPTNHIFWCKVIKPPESLRKKHHIVKFEPILPPDQNKYHIVHHMTLSYCNTWPDENLAFDNLCSHWPSDGTDCRPIVGFALGATAFYLPEEVGFPIGGPDYKFFKLNLHFTNAELRDDLVVTSGLQLYVTPTLRPYDGGTFSLGITGVFGIPPGQPHFVINGHCSSACTNHGLPAEGITVFGTHYHTHRQGRQMAVHHVRDGQRLPDIDRDNHYSTYHQEIRLLKRPAHVLPGDSLIATCVYDTTGRSTVIWRGATAEDEQCLAFVAYYPRTNLTRCQSKQNLQDMFLSLFKFGKQPTFSSLELEDSPEALGEGATPERPKDDSQCLIRN